MYDYLFQKTLMNFLWELKL